MRVAHRDTFYLFAELSIEIGNQCILFFGPFFTGRGSEFVCARAWPLWAQPWSGVDRRSPTPCALSQCGEMLPESLHATVVAIALTWLTTTFAYVTYVMPLSPSARLAAEFYGKAAFHGIMTASIGLVAHHECGINAPECVPAWTSTVSDILLWLLIVFLAFPSNTNLNPNVSISSWATGKLTIRDAALQVATQMISGVVTTSALWLVTPPGLRPYVPAPRLKYASVLHSGAFEIFACACNIQIVLFAGAFIPNVPLQAVLVATFISGLIKLTPGAFMDPSGVLANALYTGDFSALPTALVACVAGSLVGSCIFNQVMARLRRA